MVVGAPSAASAARISSRVCESAGNVNHGPHVAGAPIVVPGGAITASDSRRSSSISSPSRGSGGLTHTTRSSSPSRRPPSSCADGATDNVRSTSGRCARNPAIMSGSARRRRRRSCRRAPDPGAHRAPGRTSRPDRGSGRSPDVRGRARAAPNGAARAAGPAIRTAATPTRRSSSASPCESADGLTPDAVRSQRPRGLVGDGDQVLDLADREVGERAAPAAR